MKAKGHNNSTAGISGNEFIHYYKRQIKSFQRNSARILRRADKNDIHNLRLDIKHIKTLYFFLELSFPDNIKAKEYYRPFKDIFKRAGKVREMQVALGYMSKMKLPAIARSLFEREFKKRIRKKYQQLKKAIKNYKKNRVKGTLKEIGLLCKRLNKREFERRNHNFIMYECAKIENSIKKASDDKKIHRLRMHLKELDSVLTIVNKMEQGSSYVPLLKKVKAACVLIGRWHDKVVLKGHLSEIIKHRLKPNSADYKRIKVKINRALQIRPDFSPLLKRKVHLILVMAKGHKKIER